MNPFTGEAQMEWPTTREAKGGIEIKKSKRTYQLPREMKLKGRKGEKERETKIEMKPGQVGMEQSNCFGRWDFWLSKCQVEIFGRRRSLRH